MKNFVRILSLALVAVMLAVTLVSCGAPAKTAADAEAALKENGYTPINDDRIVPGVLALSGIASCTNKVTGVKFVEDEDGNKKTEYVAIYYFADKDSATKAMEKIGDEEKKDKDEKAEDWVSATQSGAMIYYGTKAAIKAAK